MPMRLKIIVILSIGALAVMGVISVIQRAVVAPEFMALEWREAGRDLRRVEQAVASDLEELLRSARNYGEWDDACEFVKTQDPAFVRSNLPPEIFAALKVDAIQYYDRVGKLVWGGVGSAVEGRRSARPETTILPYGLGREFLCRMDGPPSGKSGLEVADDRLLLVASYPVISSSGSGPIHGTVVFARLLTAADRRRLRIQTSVPFTLLDPEDPSISAESRRRLDNGEDVFGEEALGALRAWARLSDVRGKPARIIQVDFPRDISAQGLAAMRDERLWTVAAIVVLMSLVYWGFGRIVVRPVQRLIEHIHWVRQSGDLNARVGIHTRDEVGTLSAEFDLLLTQVARAKSTRVQSEKRLSELVQEQRDTIRRLSEGSPEEAAGDPLDPISKPQP